jgi:hypothetical protein
MIRLYNGRLIIERLKLSDNWQATYKLPNSEQITIDLCTPDIRQAFVRAQYHYLALRNKQPVEQAQEVINAKARVLVLPSLVTSHQPMQLWVSRGATNQRSPRIEVQLL